MIDIMFCCHGAKSLREQWPNKKDYDNHWRVKNDKETVSYITVVNKWNANIEINKDEYDILYNMANMKYQAVAYFLNNEFHNFKDVRFIGFPDEDLYISKYDLTDMCNYAYQNNIKVFQASVDENTAYHFGVQKHKDGIEWIQTSFFESIFPIMTVDAALKFRNYLNYANTVYGWGMDLMFEYILQEKLYVINKWKMQHPLSKQTYPVLEAQKEFEKAVRVDGPRYLKKNFNIDYEYDNTYKIYSVKFLNGVEKKEEVTYKL